MPNNSENDMHGNLFKSCFTNNEIRLCYGFRSSNCGPGTVSITVTGKIINKKEKLSDSDFNFNTKNVPVRKRS